MAAGNPAMLWRVACLKLAAQMRPAGSPNMEAMPNCLSVHNVALMAQEKRLEGVLGDFGSSIRLEQFLVGEWGSNPCLLVSDGIDGHRTIPILSVDPTPRKDGTKFKRTLYAVKTQEGEMLIASSTWVVFP